MANYGDVALALPANWNRGVFENQEAQQGTVGHTEGVADAYLTDDPEQEHQFLWVDVLQKKDIATARMRGFAFVKKDTWTKHPILWEWDAEGFCLHADQRLMARPKDKFMVDQERRTKLNSTPRTQEDADAENVPDGLIATDVKGGGDKQRPARRKGI